MVNHTILHVFYLDNWYSAFYTSSGFQYSVGDRPIIFDQVIQSNSTIGLNERKYDLDKLRFDQLVQFGKLLVIVFYQLLEYSAPD